MMLLDNVTDDFKWFMEDRAGYEAEMERQEVEFKQRFRDFMGPDFATVPLPTEEELKESAMWRSKGLQKCDELNAPDIIREHYQAELGKIVKDLKEKKFVITPAEKAYRYEYERKACRFYEMIEEELENKI